MEERKVLKLGETVSFGLSPPAETREAGGDVGSGT